MSVSHRCRLVNSLFEIRCRRRYATNKSRGAVVCTGYESAEVGRAVIARGGSAVDAAIAVKICEGVVQPASSGIGGGIVMTIYQKSTGVIQTINAREVAPSCATKYMFVGRPEAASRGGLAVAVPGELMGMHEAHQRFGCLDWKDLFQPSIEICKRGHFVTKYLEKMLKSHEKIIRKDCGLRECFVNPATNTTYQRGQCLKREKLGRTLEVIASEGPCALYNGCLTKQFVDDIDGMGGIITIEDMNRYRAEWGQPLTSNLPGKQKLHTFPLPCSGIILIFILNILKNFLDMKHPKSITNMQRIIESFKFGYAKRSELGDGNFVDDLDQLMSDLKSDEFALKIREKICDTSTCQDLIHYGTSLASFEDHGTNNICVLAPNGDAVVATSSINLTFGAGIASQSTSVILNSQMDDFSAQGVKNSYGLMSSPSNCIVPGKRPMSSMCPTIILNEEGDVRMLVGAAGGSKIITSTVLVVLRHLWFNTTLEEAVNSKRYHHQLCPMSVEYEYGFDLRTIERLEAIGHRYTIDTPCDGFASLTAISAHDGVVEAIPDVRRGGSTAFFI